MKTEEAEEMLGCKFSKVGEKDPPYGGWRSNHVYLVEVAFNKNNPIHKALFYAGFISDGIPGSYNTLWNPTYDKIEYKDIFYMKVLIDLGKIFE